MRRTIFVCGATFALVLTAMLSFLLANEEAQGQTTVNVDVGDFYFCNSSFSRGVCETNITAGDTVTWVWVGASIHTVTQCETGFINCPPAGGFYSNILSNGATFSHTFNVAGSFEYRCDLHSTEMRGRVNVAAQATPTPGGGQTTSATPTTGAGPTASAAPASTQAAAPAAIPGTGGAQADGGPSWLLVLAIAGGVLVVASAGAGLVVLRRR